MVYEISISFPSSCSVQVLHTFLVCDVKAGYTWLTLQSNLVEKLNLVENIFELYVFLLTDVGRRKPIVRDFSSQPGRIVVDYDSDEKESWIRRKLSCHWIFFCFHAMENPILIWETRENSFIVK